MVLPAWKKMVLALDNALARWSGFLISVSRMMVLILCSQGTTTPAAMIKAASTRISSSYF